MYYVLINIYTFITLFNLYKLYTMEINNNFYINDEYNEYNQYIKNININNSKAVYYINQENYNQALICLNNNNHNILTLVENKKNININKETSLIILRCVICHYNNYACCYQKLKQIDYCLIYLKKLNTYYDTNLSEEYNINSNANIIDNNTQSIIKFFDNNLKPNNNMQKLKDIGEYLLKVRFLAKFKLQLCAVLSQNSNHKEALYQAESAFLLCEENINATFYLVNLIIRNISNENGGIDYSICCTNKNMFNSDINIINNNNDNNTIENIVSTTNNITKKYNICEDNCNVINNDVNILNESPIIKSNNLKTHLLDSITKKNKSNCLEYNGFYEQIQETLYCLISLIDKIKKYKSIHYELIKKNNDKNSKEDNNNTYINNCYITERDIEQYKASRKYFISNRSLLGVKKHEDWIDYINIGNIMFINPLTFEDFDLDSDYKFELLKDAISEKIIMITVCSFCASSETRTYLDTNNVATIDGNKNLSNCLISNNLHKMSVEIACCYLPDSCPIIKHYISTYFKHYNSKQKENTNISNNNPININIKDINNSLNNKQLGNRNLPNNNKLHSSLKNSNYKKSYQSNINTLNKTKLNIAQITEKSKNNYKTIDFKKSNNINNKNKEIKCKLFKTCNKCSSLKKYFNDNIKYKDVNKKDLNNKYSLIINNNKYNKLTIDNKSIDNNVNTNNNTYNSKYSSYSNTLKKPTIANYKQLNINYNKKNDIYSNLLVIKNNVSVNKHNEKKKTLISNNNNSTSLLNSKGSNLKQLKNKNLIDSVLFNSNFFNNIKFKNCSINNNSVNYSCNNINNYINNSDRKKCIEYNNYIKSLKPISYVKNYNKNMNL